MANLLKHLFETTGLTQMELAGQTGVPQCRLSLLMNGKVTRPYGSEKEKLEKWSGSNINFLLGETDDAD